MNIKVQSPQVKLPIQGTVLSAAAYENIKEILETPDVRFRLNEIVTLS